MRWDYSNGGKLLEQVGTGQAGGRKEGMEIIISAF